MAILISSIPKGALMDQQVSIEKKPAQEIGMTFEISQNSSRRVVRQISVSGPGSEGEKSLLKKNPGWLISPKVKTPVFNSCLSSLDEVVATPSFNVSVIENACYKDFKFFDAINNSKYVASIDSAIAGIGLFAVSIGVYIVKYSTLREIERHSNYFYFNRLFKAHDKEYIKNKMGEIEPSTDSLNSLISFEHLLTASYFYPPDISKIANWRRRFFASKKEKECLKSLNGFMKNNSKKDTLNKLHNEITKKVCQLLNKETKFENFKTKKYKDHWTIVLSDNYATRFFEHIEHLIKDNSKKTKENNDKFNRNFFPAILTALGQASFIYWIWMFIFCFIPMAPVVTTAFISVIPLVLALFVALPYILFVEIKKTNEIYKFKKNLTEEMIETQHKHMLEKKLVDLNKQKIFFDFLSKKTNTTVKLNNSPLMKDLQGVLKNRSFSKYHAICMGFLDGCFLPLFAGWLLLDGTKVIMTLVLCSSAYTSFTPIGLLATAIIVGITLLIGISYGIYSAYKAKQIHEVKCEELEAKVTALRADLKDKQILNKPLRDYDRILRRFSAEQPKWTGVKKGLSRLLVIIKRLGTGSLVFRLVIWGPISATVAASTAVVPTFFPIILIIGTVIGALIIAIWYVIAYQLESKIGQAGRIVEHFVQTEQLDCINRDLEKKLADESLDVEDDVIKIALISKKLAKLPENETQISSSEVIQKDTIDAENHNLDEINSVKTQIKSIQANPNLHGLFKNIQNKEKADQDMEVCLSNKVVSC